MSPFDLGDKVDSNLSKVSTWSTLSSWLMYVVGGTLARVAALINEGHYLFLHSIHWQPGVFSIFGVGVGLVRRLVKLRTPECRT